MTIIIEKDVELTVSMSGKGRAAKYPFADMVSGDSFFVPCEKEAMSKTRESIRNSARYQNVYRVAIRAVDGGIRVWCITRNKESK